jgi:hypothetical protein
MKRKGVIGVPEDGDLRAHPGTPQEPVQVEDRVDGVPFLGQDDGLSALPHVG